MPNNMERQISANIVQNASSVTGSDLSILKCCPGLSSYVPEMRLDCGWDSSWPEGVSGGSGGSGGSGNETSL